MRVLDLYITKVCNLHCDYCYVDLVENEEGATFGNISKKINLLEYDHIKFFGGEPLLKFELITQIVRSVKEKRQDMIFTVVTNGLLLDNKKNNFFIEFGINIVFSFHKKGAKKLLEVIQKIDNKQSLNISLIFECSDLLFPFKMVKLLYHLGFRNFIFSPEIYSRWSEEEIQALEKELQYIFDYAKEYKDIKIGGFEKYYLQKYERDCHKSIYDEKGDYHKCNRFKSLKDSGVNYDEVYDFFEQEIDLANNPLRWFYICPIGWYLDSKSSTGNQKNEIIKRAHIYDALNRVFIRFYKKIVHENNIFSYYRDDISEIRLNLTDQCNIRCDYCYVDFKNKFLEESIGKQIIEFYLEQPGESKVISFFGGEPLLEFGLLEKLVNFAIIKSKGLSKNITFKIATNFLLVNKKILDFLIKNNFEIHISWNGSKVYHDQSRDKTYVKLIEKVSTIHNKNSFILLYVVTPERYNKVFEDILHMYSFGFRKINFEFLLSKNETKKMKKNDILQLITQFKKVSFLQGLEIKNLESKRLFLDISTSGKSSDNSLDFHGFKTDFTQVQNMNLIIKKIFQN